MVSGIPSSSINKFQDLYILETHNAIELLHKELDVNHEEQRLLAQRIEICRNNHKNHSSDEKIYQELMAQIEIDQIELGQLQERAKELSVKKQNLAGGQNL